MGYQFSSASLDNGTDRGQMIPTSILEDNLMSETSEAYLCFTQQAFSSKLQAFMINYVISTSSLYSVYS